MDSHFHKIFQSVVVTNFGLHDIVRKIVVITVHDVVIPDTYHSTIAAQALPFIPRMAREFVTIYTTSAWPGHIVRLTGNLIKHGTIPTSENPRVPFVIYAKNRPERTIKRTESYLLVVRGDCPVIPNNQFDLLQLPFPPFSIEWRTAFDRDFNQWLENHQDALIADYRVLALNQ